MTPRQTVRLKQNTHFSTRTNFLICITLAWGDDSAPGFGVAQSGFDGDEEGFDTFLAMSAPPPAIVSVWSAAHINRRTFNTDRHFSLPNRAIQRAILARQ